MYHINVERFRILVCIAYVVLITTLIFVDILNPGMFMHLDHVYWAIDTVNAMVIVMVATCAFITLSNRAYEKKSAALEQSYSELQQAIVKMQEAQNKALTDSLTGLYNRAYFELHRNEEMITINQSLGMMMLDIDYFKKVNDSYGHLKGDECLQHIGHILLNFMDSNEGYCIRYGGEEFLICYKSISEQELAVKAEKLRLEVEQSNIGQHLGIERHITVSIGYAVADSNQSIRELIEEADNNLYAAKQEGRNCIYPNIVNEKYVENRCS